MTLERREVLITFLEQQLGLPRARRLVVYSVVGIVCCLLVAGILASVVIDGATGSDDVWVPMFIVLGLAPVMAIGVFVGRARTRAIHRHEIVLALRQTPPGIARVDRSVDRWGIALRLTAVGGVADSFYMDAATADEFAAWLAPGSG